MEDSSLTPLPLVGEDTEMQMSLEELIALVEYSDSIIRHISLLLYIDVIALCYCSVI